MRKKNHKNNNKDAQLRVSTAPLTARPAELHVGFHPLAPRSPLTLNQIAEHIWTHDAEGCTVPNRICITGDGGAGKTTLAHLLINLSRNRATLIEIDDFAIPRQVRKQQNLNGYSPQSFSFQDFRACCVDLSQMRSTFVPHYSHQDGTSCRNVDCNLSSHGHHRNGRDIMIGVGVFLWLDSEHINWDLKIFVSDDRSDREARRLYRDINERGYSQSEAAEHYALLEKARRHYILPSLDYCSIHVHRVGETAFHLETA